VFEQDFLPCSFGFRPGRSAHQALQYLRAGFMSQRLRWVIDTTSKNILIRYHTLTFGTFLTGESWMALIIVRATELFYDGKQAGTFSPSIPSASWPLA